MEDVDAAGSSEVRLRDDGEERCEVGMADVEPVGCVGVARGVLSEGYLEEFLPEFAFDSDGGIIAVLVVGALEERSCLLEQVAVDAEVLGEGGSAGDDVLCVSVDDVVEVFPQDGALPGLVEYEHATLGDGQDVIADATLEVVLAVCEDAVLDPKSGLYRFEQILVELAGIRGVDLSADDEVALELDVGVADGEIDTLDAVRSGRRLGADVAFICDDVGADDEVAEGGADVVL